MSIALLITEPGDAAASRMVPVATQADFARYWLPTCQDLALRWIPRFETGTSLGPGDVVDVLVELRHLQGTVAPDVAAMIGDRLQGLIDELTALVGRDDVDVFVG